MEAKTQEQEKEIVRLQNSLSASLATISQLQISESAKDEKIKYLNIFM